MRNEPLDSGLDGRGFFLKRASKNLIRSPYTRVLAALRQTLSQQVDTSIHSVYLYGSVARGTAVPGKSDLDVTAVVHRETYDDHSAAFLAELGHTLEARFPFLAKVDIPHCTVDDVLSTETLHSWGFWIKVICTCVHGDDLAKRLPRFRPSWALALGLNGDVGTYVQRMMDFLGTRTQQDLSLRCRSVGRKLVHSAFCLVMPLEKVWIDDYEECASLFAKHYPHQENNIKKAARWAHRPDGSRDDILGVLQDLGVHLTAEFERIRNGQQQT